MNRVFDYSILANCDNALIGEKDKAEEFIKNVQKFEDIETIEEARELAKQLFSAENEFQRFSVGSYDCTVVSKKDIFRICVNGNKTFICYDF